MSTLAEEHAGCYTPLPQASCFGSIYCLYVSASSTGGGGGGAAAASDGADVTLLDCFCVKLYSYLINFLLYG